MKAIVYNKYGSPDVLHLEEVEKPTPKDDEVLVKVQAAAVNDWDWALMRGIPYVSRMENGLFKPKKFKILGFDIAGQVEAVGKDVVKFKAGDEVHGDLAGSLGGFAEYVCAPEKALVLKPAKMTFEEAASIPQAGMLAVQGLIDKGQLQEGQKVLINGAGGGVGTFALQIAKTFEGVEVTGVDSTGKLDMMRSIGFDHVIDYTKEDFTKNGHQYDLILDQKTNRSISQYLGSLKHNGKYITTGGVTSRIFPILTMGSLISKFSKKQFSIVLLKPNKDLAYMNELFEAGKIKPVIDGPYKLEEVPDTFWLFENGNHKGKIVIKIDNH